ncbi:MAG: type II toxin-antitoxin system Phd/YefM family antitoxin [Desulfobacterota bacterium]|jgi:prevent-host-death family protein|nr:type II toxin-antitoxin system Phd/YefM family antitoxin [Thermodesulfobacteriota bacterium]
MRAKVATRTKRNRRAKEAKGRPTIGIRELKARASAIIEEVKDRRTSYAVTKRGEVEALIVPVDAGNRLLSPSPADSAWEAWQALADQLARKTRGRKGVSAVEELDRMRR